MSKVVPLFPHCPVHRPCDTESMVDPQITEVFTPLRIAHIRSVKGCFGYMRFMIWLEGEAEYYPMTLTEVNMVLSGKIPQ
jgi:hypothetical protein